MTQQQRPHSMTTIRDVWLKALPQFPRVGAGDDLAALTLASLVHAAVSLQPDDVLVYAQKVVSKAEGRRIDLRKITPSPRALELAQTVRKDARLVELILRESRRIVRTAPDVLITEHRLGLIMANAGIDQSNVAAERDGEFALLLPEDPDASAAQLREQLGRRSGVRPAVIISDSFGRPWRLGTVGVAIGCAGFPALRDLRGRPDLFGRRLRVTQVGCADQVAAAAALLMGQSDEGQPVVLLRGLRPDEPYQPAAALLRPASGDLFR